MMQSFYKNKRIIYAFFLILYMFMGGMVRSKAAVNVLDYSDFDCTPQKTFFERIIATVQQGIARTTVAFLSTVLTDWAPNFLMQASLNEIVGCQKDVAEALQSTKLPVSSNACSGTDAKVCKSIMNNFQFGSFSDTSVGFDLRESRVSGSLLGLGYSLENFNDHSPDIVNLAYFWNDTVSRVPLLNKALAADSEPYPFLLVNQVLGAWKIVRNLSFALMAGVFMFTGILIVMRRSVNQKLVVTVQYALPKIVIGLILIAFSYPIGATITTLAVALSHSGPSIAGSLFSDIGILGTNMGVLVVYIVTLAIAAVGIGATSLALLVFVLMAVILMWVYIQFKMFIIYIKMVFSILTAPIEFALGSIPGSEDKTTGWFKRMGKYTLTLFLMDLITPLTMYLSMQLLVGGSTANELSAFGFLVGVLVSPFVLIYGLGLASGMEGKVEGWLGEGKRK